MLGQDRWGDRPACYEYTQIENCRCWRHCARSDCFGGPLVHNLWRSGGAVAQNQGQGQRGVAIRRRDGGQQRRRPVTVEALGTVTPIASVAIKPRIDSEIATVQFADGARVREGDVLMTLDKRSIAAPGSRPLRASWRAIRRAA